MQIKGQEFRIETRIGIIMGVSGSNPPGPRNESITVLKA